MSEQKQCKKCGLFFPIEDFRVNKKMTSGRVNQCRKCLNEMSKQSRHRNIEKVRKKDRLRSKNDKKYIEQKKAAYQKKKGTAAWKEKIKEYRKTDDIVNKEKYEARLITKDAIRRGILKRIPCEVCGEEKSEAHHKNYDDPLDIIFLCRKHHAELHAKLREKQRVS